MTGTGRFHIAAIDPTTGSPGQVPTINPAGDALEYADPGGGTTPATRLVPLTTTVGGTPQLVWDENDNLVMTEVPA